MDSGENNPTVNDAIDAALSGNWQLALEINTQLLKIEPENVDSLNRLARAHFETNNYVEAKKLYSKVIELDPYNSIAARNIKNLSLMKKEGMVITPHKILSPDMFLQEPGVTKLVTLIKVAEPQKLSTLSSGTIVELVAKTKGITVTDSAKNYVGVLPDDIAHQLLRFIEGGNKYQAIIKSVKPNLVSILIRETFRSKKFKDQASFVESSTSSSNFDNMVLDAPSLDDREEPEELG